MYAVLPFVSCLSLGRAEAPNFKRALGQVVVLPFDFLALEIRNLVVWGFRVWARTVGGIDFRRLQEGQPNKA